MFNTVSYTPFKITMTKNILYIFLLISTTFCTNSISAQIRRFEADPIYLAHVDSNTLKIRNKLYPQILQGDLNIYGFEENDIPVYADSVYAYRLSIH